MEKYINYEMCKKCGGACCKENACIYMPKDFESMEFSCLRNELEKGKISVSGQPTKLPGGFWTYVPFLRARNKDADIIDLITNGGPCINLTDNGCALNEEERPSFGLLVKPKKIGGPCPTIDSNSGILWLDYSKVLERLVKYYANGEIIDIVVDEISKEIVKIKKKMENGEELSKMEKQNGYWYYSVIANSPYLSPKEVKRMMRH